MVTADLVVAISGVLSAQPLQETPMTRRWIDAVAAIDLKVALGFALLSPPDVVQGDLTR